MLSMYGTKFIPVVNRSWIGTLYKSGAKISYHVAYKHVVVETALLLALGDWFSNGKTNQKKQVSYDIHVRNSIHVTPKTSELCPGTSGFQLEIHLEEKGKLKDQLKSYESIKDLDIKDDVPLKINLYETRHLLSPNFILDDENGKRIIYKDSRNNFTFYHGFDNNDKMLGFFIKDIDSQSFVGKIGLKDKIYKVLPRNSIKTNNNNSIYWYEGQLIEKLKGRAEGFEHDYKYEKITKEKVAPLKMSRKLLKGPFYIEGSFLNDGTEVNQNHAFLLAAEIDYILRDPSIRAPVYFILNEFTNYPANGPLIKHLDDLDIFCNWTVQRRIKKSEDVTFYFGEKWAQVANRSLTVGYTAVDGICEPKQSCALLYPDSDIGVTVAHELGHLLGAHHDMTNECNDVGKRGIMHYDTKYPEIIKWSTCSSYVIMNNLMKLKNKCLLNGKPRENKIPNANDVCINDFMEESDCLNLFCEGRIFYNANLDGEFCYPSTQKLSQTNQGYICYQGNCTDLKVFDSPVDGAWGSWENNPTCEGSDIVGYQIRERKCDNPEPKYGGKYCLGLPIQFSTCNTKQQTPSYDVNEKICALYSSTFSFKHQKGCRLMCRNKKQKTIRIPGRFLSDGTIVKMNGQNRMCINGIPMYYECGNKIRFKSLKDACGVCNGKNNTCKVISKDKNLNFDHKSTGII